MTSGYGIDWGVVFILWGFVILMLSLGMVYENLSWPVAVLVILAGGVILIALAFMAQQQYAADTEYEISQARNELLKTYNKNMSVKDLYGEITTMCKIYTTEPDTCIDTLKKEFFSLRLKEN